MDGEISFTSTFQRRHVLGVLRVILELFGNAVPFGELFDRDLKTGLDCLGRPSASNRSRHERRRTSIPLILNSSSPALLSR